MQQKLRVARALSGLCALRQGALRVLTKVSAKNGGILRNFTLDCTFFGGLLRGFTPSRDPAFRSKTRSTNWKIKLAGEILHCNVRTGQSLGRLGQLDPCICIATKVTIGEGMECQPNEMNDPKPED